MGSWLFAYMMLAVCTLQIYKPKPLESYRVIKSLQSRNPSDPRLRDFLRDHSLEVTALPLAIIGSIVQAGT